MHRLTESLSRRRLRHPRLTDVLLVLFVAFPPAMAERPEWRPLWVQAVVYAALALPLLWRRRYPVAVAVIVTAAFWAQCLGQVWGPEPGRGALALAAVLYSLVVRGLRRPAALSAAFAGVCMLVLLPAWLHRYEDFSGPATRQVWVTPLTTVLMLAGAWILGEYLRARRAYLAEFERRIALAESERLALARAAVAEERGRIAREIHDILAHSVSVMVVNAEGGRLMRHTDPDAVDRTLGVISATGRDALGELRRLLDVLATGSERGDATGTRSETAGTGGNETAGDGQTPGAPELAAVPVPAPADDSALGDGPGLGPQPALTDLHRLVARFGAGRTPATLDLTGDTAGLPAGAALQTYRIVQEALTNVIKHASPDALTHVRVALTPLDAGRLIRIRVDNTGATGNGGARAAFPSSGRGLAGMRERAALFGGTVQAGATPDGGYRVAATLAVVEQPRTVALP
ncbi:sensor histidine kinase [Streptomyces sp. NPDC058001]|uniref:sensor histidine kinase n=1 Tax=Streptomyces sp. NPDC058001 TaxID=3346300 RepID=UPI0036ECFC57